MNSMKPSYPAAPTGLQFEVDSVTAWLRGEGVCEEGCHVLIGCFTSTFMFSLPRPKHFKVGDFTVVQRSRHLWYRKAASLLGWVHRRSFPEEIRSILNKVYVDVPQNVVPTHAAAFCPCLPSKIEASTGNDRVGGPPLPRVMESVQGGGSRGPSFLTGGCYKAATLEAKLSTKGAKGEKATEQGGGLDRACEKRKLPWEERWREGMRGPNRSHPSGGKS
jgi:hypothetical protein